MLWTLAFTLPVMTAVQEASARIGLVTGQGLAAIIRKRYGAPFVIGCAVLLGIANTINVGADLAGMAAAARLVVPAAPQWITGAVFAMVILALEVFMGYDRYSSILKWLAGAMLAYPIVALISSVHWDTVLTSTIIPRPRLDANYLFILTAVLGTTISPYLFFWESSQEVEDVQHLRKSRRRISKRGLARKMRVDNAAGMIMSNVIAWFVMVVAATVLNAHGVTNVSSAADVAKALEPLVKSFPHAGFIAGAIFAVGIIGLGALAVPVLAGAASYAFAEAFGWNRGLDRSIGEAPRFYAVIAIAIAIGLAITLAGINPIRLLVWSAVINGIVAAPMVIVVGRIAADRGLMGQHKSGKLSNVLVSLTAVAMGLCAVATIAGLIVK
jgi:Mn2+/Fe2+ NRAMP family transporter